MGKGVDKLFVWNSISPRIGLAYQLAQVRFLERLAARVASAEAAGQDAAVGADKAGTGGHPTE